MAPTWTSLLKQKHVTAYRENGQLQRARGSDEILLTSAVYSCDSILNLSLFNDHMRRQKDLLKPFRY